MTATHGDQWPAPKGNSFWLEPGEDIQTAKCRSWMTPNWFAKWMAAKTPEDKQRIAAAAGEERTAFERDQAERVKARRQAAAEQAAKAERERAEHQRRFQDAVIRLADQPIAQANDIPATPPKTEVDPRLDAALRLLRAKHMDPAACRAAELFMMGKRGDEAGALMVDKHNNPRRMSREGWRKALIRFGTIAGLPPDLLGDNYRQHARRKGKRRQAEHADDIRDAVDRRLTSG